MSKALAVAVLGVLGACAGDDDDATPSTPPEVTTVVSAATTAPGTTDPATTSSPTTGAPTTPPATTDPAPPTTTEDDLKAVIAADVEAAGLANFAYLVDPSLEALPAHVAAVAAPGSPVEASLTAYVTQLVSLGDGIVPGDPDILTVIVERVDLVGAAPYTMALATICEVENRPQATLSKNTSDGRIIYVQGSGDLQATRSIKDIRLVPAGWRYWETEPDSTVVYLGRDVCPPS